MNMRNVLLAATVLVAPIAAKAQPVTGPYVSLGAGYSYTDKWSANAAGSPNTTLTNARGGSSLSGNGGPVFQGSFGWGFGNGLRVELEGNYFNQHERLSAPSPLVGGGYMQSFGALANVLYDFDLGNNVVYPYIGAGVGVAVTSLNGNHVSAKIGATTYNLTMNGQETGLAAQGIAGLAFPIAAVPGLSVTAEYRFLAVFTDQSFGGGNNTGSYVKYGDQYNNQGLIGVRYAFGAPTPPPPPAPAPVAAPAPAPARTYLVFFDWDKSDLTARAKQIIGEAAQASTRVAVTKIQVNGYTDRSGSPAYNQTLSVKRGNSVAAELVKDGVPKASISVQGFGETHPLVPTADGVREAQNRRVEIILQ